VVNIVSPSSTGTSEVSAAETASVPRPLSTNTLSITTAPPSLRKPPPYDDRISQDSLLRYRYRGSDPQHPENVGLRLLWQARIPLIYFYGVIPGKYYPVFPAWIVADNPAALEVTVEADDPASSAAIFDGSAVFDAPDRRRYVTREVEQRLHQHVFRERVVAAYGCRCAICRLKHGELLDAAHIVEDKDPRGVAEVCNGLALCKLHHAAFDGNFLGITPDYVIRLRDDIRQEHDGPMLIYGIQAFHDQKIRTPRQPALRPNRDLLAERFARFTRSA
jgi:putative restriction endonuclease